MIEADVIRRNGKVFAVVGEEVYPVTDMIDKFGNDCELENAVIVVVGPTKEGKWLTIDVVSPFQELN